jgi:outer membrane immunogenic protein
MEYDMKNYLVAGVAALTVFGAGAALASDLPARKGPVPAPQVYLPPAFTWTGFYAGVNAGYAFRNDDTATTTGTPGFRALVPGGVAPGSLKVGSDGFIGGAQIGYNYQINQIVFGLETDIQYVDNKGGSTFIGNPVLGTQLRTGADSELTYLGTLRARLGYTPMDRLLIYATGGLAYGEVKSNASVAGVQAPALGWSGSKSDVKFGWTAGAGAEYALTNNWTLKGEYLYYDLGKSKVTTAANAAAAAAVPGVAYLNEAKNNGHIVRAGVNYKF